MSKKTIDQAKRDYLLDPKNNVDPNSAKGKKVQYRKPKSMSEGMTEQYFDSLNKKNTKTAKDRLMHEVKTGKKITKKKVSRGSDDGWVRR